MAVPFGFSVGDFIAGINLIITSIQAVRDGKGSSAQFQALTWELTSLKSGLGAIHELNLEQTAQKEYVAIREAVAGCELCIESFVRGVSKYQPWLKPGVDGWKASFRKIQWAFCNKKDVAGFRDQLERHSSAINMLLVTLQVRQGLEQKEMQKTCEATSKETFDTTVEVQVTVSRSHDILKGLSEQQRTVFQDMMCMIGELTESNKQLVQQVAQFQQQLPAQVLLQKPVVLLDACGRAAPFHLDFIDSKEAFLAVLKIRFEQCGVTPQGIGKIDRFEFILRDRRRDISLNAPWQTVFKPGQNAAMSMVFRRLASGSTCPGCGSVNEEADQCDTECTKCGLEYCHRVENPASLRSPLKLESTGEDRQERTALREQAYLVEELSDFRRVQILVPPSPPPPLPPPRYVHDIMVGSMEEGQMKSNVDKFWPGIREWEVTIPRALAQARKRQRKVKNIQAPLAASRQQVAPNGSGRSSPDSNRHTDPPPQSKTKKPQPMQVHMGTTSNGKRPDSTEGAGEEPLLGNGSELPSKESLSFSEQIVRSTPIGSAPSLPRPLPYSRHRVYYSRNSQSNGDLEIIVDPNRSIRRYEQSVYRYPQRNGDSEVKPKPNQSTRRSGQRPPLVYTSPQRNGDSEVIIEPSQSTRRIERMQRIRSMGQDYQYYL